MKHNKSRNNKRTLKKRLDKKTPKPGSPAAGGTIERIAAGKFCPVCYGINWHKSYCPDPQEDDIVKGGTINRNYNPDLI